MNLHIHAPKGDYLAQIRGRGCRLWETVGEAHEDAKSAMCTAINAMTERHKRARVIFCAEWYDPIVAMEAQRP